MKQGVKAPQKIRQARICMLNAQTQKKQTSKKTNNHVDTYAHRMKNIKMQQCKKLHY